ncbi:MAG: hypothetical protein R3260_01300 [Pseudomonas sp.]|nr:hypothetical protein [Pseudomonas sp.]
MTLLAAAAIGRVRGGGTGVGVGVGVGVGAGAGARGAPYEASPLHLGADA